MVEWLCCCYKISFLANRTPSFVKYSSFVVIIPCKPFDAENYFPWQRENETIFHLHATIGREIHYHNRKITINNHQHWSDKIASTKGTKMNKMLHIMVIRCHLLWFHFDEVSYLCIAYQMSTFALAHIAMACDISWLCHSVASAFRFSRWEAINI